MRCVRPVGERVRRRRRRGRRRPSTANTVTMATARPRRADLPPLQQDHQRVEQQGDEARHHDEQEDLAQLVDDLAGQEVTTTTATVVRMACKRDAPLVGPLPQPGAPGHRRRGSPASAQHGSFGPPRRHVPTHAGPDARGSDVEAWPDAAGAEAPPARVRRQVKWGVYAVGCRPRPRVPGPAPARRGPQVREPTGKINIAYVIAGVVLEAAALVSYSQLTHTVLLTGGPAPLAAAAHQPVEPGRQPHHAGRHRTGDGASPTGCSPSPACREPTPASLWPCRAWAPPLVLNSILWLALLVSVFLHGYNPLYAVAAGAGVRAHGLCSPRWCVALTKGRDRSIEVIRRWAITCPSWTATSSPSRASTAWPTASASSWPSARCCCAGRRCGRRPSGCSTPRRLFVFVAALASYRLAHRPPGRLRPGQRPRRHPHHPRRASASSRASSSPPWRGFGVPRGRAILGVLGYRLVNFWLPIPVGASPTCPCASRSAGASVCAGARRSTRATVVERHEPVEPGTGARRSPATSEHP